MTTSPLEERLNRGRGASTIRTPRLIRDYLSGQGVFPKGTPRSGPLGPPRGDYIARTHRRIKLYIRSQDPAYQYPRHHSFLSRASLYVTQHYGKA